MTDTTIDWPTEKIAELLGQVTLTAGHHADGARACAMDLIGMAIDGEWTDTPSCVHPILARAVHRINDDPASTAEDRLALVLDAGPHLIGTNDKIRSPWAVMVAYRAGRTAPGLVAALASTPPRANLSGANLSGADLSGANLYGANLSGADLYGANLSGANLSWANLSWANLSRADLSRANLSGADLYGANLYGADLYGADLSGADLSGANLSGAYLSGAYLSGADLSGANRLDEARNVPEDVLTAWKATGEVAP